MARPIPINRRWLENQQRRQSSTPRPPAPPRGVNYAQTRRELLEELLPPRAVGTPAPSDDSGSPRVIPARYRQTCAGCGEPIEPGMRITRHPQWGIWVHEGCRARQQRAAAVSFPARYPGICRACTRPIQVGHTITRRVGYGWVHQECVHELTPARNRLQVR